MVERIQNFYLRAVNCNLRLLARLRSPGYVNRGVCTAVVYGGMVTPAARDGYPRFPPVLGFGTSQLMLTSMRPTKQLDDRHR